MNGGDTEGQCLQVPVMLCFSICVLLIRYVYCAIIHQTLHLGFVYFLYVCYNSVKNIYVYLYICICIHEENINTK